MHKIWYQSPALSWREALPIGNGFTGAMIYGGKSTEKLCFNDGTLWSGYPKDYNNAQSAQALSQVRSLIFEGRNDEADALAQEKMKGFYSETFLPLGEAEIKISSSKNSSYRRELDLSSGIHTVTANGVMREAFASNPQRIVAYKIRSQDPVSVTVKMKSKLCASSLAEGDMLFLTGNAPDYAAPNYVRTELFPVKYNERKGMAFALAMRVKADGTVISKRNKIHIKCANNITLYFTTETGFRGYDKMPDTDRSTAKLACTSRLCSVKASYEQIKNEHIADFGSLYGKQSVSLGIKSHLSADMLLKNAKQGGDIRPLCELFYNYGKYMTVSASRRGGQAMNLQGIWNNSVRPPWSSNYTVNINTQMNYWGASACGLTECIEPFFSLVYEAMQNGRKTAKINYGCSGFACNHNVDIWRKTPPVKGTSNYMLEPLCGVWLANELYAHFKNGALPELEDKIIEITEEAARFAADYLVLHNGRYVVCPSPSPENSFSLNGKKCYLDYASAFDTGLVKQSFINALEATKDARLEAVLRERLEKLSPFTKGETGINEWHKYYFTPEKGHRHFSPLYAFYPSKLIGFNGDKEKTRWIRQLFEYRIENSGQHIGWSAAWAICIAARLRDAKTAERMTRDFLCNAVFKNLFCVHPPYYFQIDGNLGYLAGLNEMLITEENGVVELLPALPDGWKSGSVEKIVVGSAEITFKWENGEVTELHSDRPVKVRSLHLSDKIIMNELVTEVN